MILKGENRNDFLKKEILADLFEQTASKYPNKTALIYGPEKITYSELDHKANILAHHLIKRGVKPGNIVGLWLPRGLNLLIAQLAIAKTGAAWLPFEADTPSDRILVCLDDAKAIGIITGHGWGVNLVEAQCEIWLAEEIKEQPEGFLLRREEVNPEEPAYIIYTSGSTGKPKGVPINQGSICHFLRSENSVLGVCSEDIVYQGFSVSFDMSFEEIWISYLVGATLWIAPKEITANPDALPIALQENGITVLHAVPTLLALFSQDVPNLRIINLGGEMCPQTVVERWATPNRKLFNTYGPTEATVSASLAQLQPGVPVTIGQPLPNYGLLVIDENMNLLPQGETGELCIIGPGVSFGYLGRPELTAEKFLKNPWAESEHDTRLYKTGDLARIDEKGQIQCLGRADDQIKIRGFRVELGEIEAELAKHIGNGTVAVILKQVGDIDQLVAYIVPPIGESINPVHLRNKLKETLPPYMVPSHFEIVNDIPRLTSGKIDRKALRAMPMSEVNDSADSDTPKDSVEEFLFPLLARFFPGLPIRRDCDFFDDLGGHSLLAARFVSAIRANEQFKNMTVNDIYRNRKIHKIADVMRETLNVGGNATIEWENAPRSRRLLCGLAQAVTLPLLLVLHMMNWLAPFFTYHLLTGEPDDKISRAILWSVAVFLLSHLVNVLISSVGSRLLLKGIKPGRYPLWSATHYRWWFGDRLQQVAPAYLLSGSYLYNKYLRMLGAKIGHNVVIGSVTIRQPHLLTVEDGASIGSNVNLENVRVERGELVIGSVHIGKEGYVGSYSVMEGDTQIEEFGRLEGLSSLERNKTIKKLEVWDGSPSRLIRTRDMSEIEARPETTNLRKVCETIFFTMGAGLTSVLFFLPVFPAFAIIDYFEDIGLAPHLHDEGYLNAIFDYTLLALPASALLIIFTALLSAVIRWTVLPKLKPGKWPVHSNLYCRKWVANQIQVASLHVLHGVYATVYAPLWYRLLGAKIGKNAEISTAMGLIPDMLTLGDETFIADAVMLGDEEIDRGVMSIDYTVIGDKSFVGNGAYIPDGTTLPSDVLIGVQSKAPQTEKMKSGETWFGTPAMNLPSREKLEGFPDNLTFKPSLLRRIGRAIVEAIRIVLPLSVIIGSGYVFVQAAMPAAESGKWLKFVLQLAFIGIIYGIGCFVLVFLLKWLLIGRYKPRAVPMWTPFVWVSEAITSIYESIAVPNFLQYLRGTPMLPCMLRLMGAKIGKNVYMDTIDITEFDCVEIGDNCEFNAWAGPQTHLFEDRIMKIGKVKVGNGVTIGVRTTVLYNAEVGENVEVGPLTLVMKGESIPEKTAWYGSPAQPWKK